MAGRGRTTYLKKQKEQLRLERRQEKAAKKHARKAAKNEPGAGDGDSDSEEFESTQNAPETGHEAP